MGKDFKGKEPGKEISQESTGLYSARFVEFRFAEVKKRIRGFQKFQQNGKSLCFCAEKEHQSRTVHMTQRCLKSVTKQKSQDFRCIS